MLLAIDCGNTNTVFAIWDGTQFLGTWRTATETSRTADQYYVYLSSLMRLNNLEVPIDEVIISSTVPRVVFNLRVLCATYFDCRPLVVGKPDCALPTEPRVDAGTQVGPDRLVNTAAAFDRHGGDLVVAVLTSRSGPTWVPASTQPPPSIAMEAIWSWWISAQPPPSMSWPTMAPMWAV